MTTFKKNFAVLAGAALFALVSLALPFAPAHATDMDSFDFYPMDMGGGLGGDSYDFYPMDTGYGDSYDFYPMDTYGSGGSFGGTSFGGMPSFGSSGSSASMPRFPQYNTSSANAQARSQVAQTLPAFALPNISTVETCSAVNSCNVDNSYTDNSVYAPDNSYTYTNTVTDNSVFSAPVTYGPVTIAQDDHSAKVIYADEREEDRDERDYDYDYPVFRQPQYPSYQPPMYQPPMPVYPQQPIVYNKPAPYVTLSSVPYTGLDLGTTGTILYWGFLAVWCALLAYLIVYKRVQNKLVAALNGFLFGTTTAAHTTHAPAAPKAVAKAEVVEADIDPFIASQINRA